MSRATRGASRRAWRSAAPRRSRAATGRSPRGRRRPASRRAAATWPSSWPPRGGRGATRRSGRAPSRRGRRARSATPRRCACPPRRRRPVTGRRATRQPRTSTAGSRSSRSTWRARRGWRATSSASILATRGARASARATRESTHEAAARAAHDPQARVGAGASEEELGAAVLRAVVHRDDLVVAERLRGERVETGAERRRRVADREENRDAGQGDQPWRRTNSRAVSRATRADSPCTT